MSRKSLKLSLILFLCASAFNQKSVYAKNSKSPSDAEKDFSDKDIHDHIIVKRVVNWSPRRHSQSEKQQQPAISYNEFYQGYGNKNDEDYEGISVESTKPRKEKLEPRLSMEKFAPIAAKYDSVGGVQCPSPDATGLFAYPPDCKFYVTCWKGRAFVQPCAPGTLFSPETLECDFPDKVQCYGGELSEFPGNERREPLLEESQAKYENQREISCPVNMNGLLVHPSDCQKYLQCANGETFIYECGDGTVFNPNLSVCDWPHNVPGCQITDNKYDKNVDSNSGQPQTNHDYSSLIDIRFGDVHQNPSGTILKPTSAPLLRNSGLSNQIIACPQGFSGLLPHPQTCKKFLQCANGATYVMDCGPGTVFNPISMLCDWPHSVPGCTDEESSFVKSSNINRIPTIPPTTETTTRYQQNYRSTELPTYSTTHKNWNNRGYQGSYVISYNPNKKSNSENYQPHPPLKGQNNQEQSYYNNYDRPLENQWQSTGETDHNHELPTDSKYQGSSTNYQITSDSYNLDVNNNQQHLNNHGLEASQTNYQGSYASHPNHNIPASNPSHNFNGHMSPYLPQNIHSQSQSQSHRDAQNESSDSSEEGPQNGQGQAWAVPASSEKPWMRIPTDRREYGRTSDTLGSETKWSVPETVQSRPESFQPSTWRGLGPGFEHRPTYPSRFNTGQEVPNRVTNNEKTYARPIITSTYNLAPASNRLNTIDAPAAGSKNNTRGWHGTSGVIINQGHSKMRQQNFTNFGAQNITKTPLDSKITTTTYIPDMIFPDQLNDTLIKSLLSQNSNTESRESNEKNKEFEYRTSNNPKLPTVEIELEEDWNSSLPIVTKRPISWSQQTVSQKSRDKFEPDEISTEEDEDFTVEVETSSSKKTWKPQLVFPNKNRTRSKEDKSVIMRVGNGTSNYNFSADVEEAPFLDEQPPFPAHFNSAAHSTFNTKPDKKTPLSGQVVRLRGGSNSAEGYVEVQGKYPGWGQVCDSRDGWTLKEAHIVCKQLGYGRGAVEAWQGRPKNSQVPTWIAANSVTCQGNETKFQLCKFTHKSQCSVERDAIAVRCLPHRVAHCRGDEIPHDGQCYHFAESDKALNHAEAHEYCHQRGSRVVDIIDQNENDFISEMLIKHQPQVDTIMTSGMGFTTLNMTIWMWEDSSVAKFKFTKWWPGWMGEKKVAPFAGSRPVCILMTRKYPCHERPENSCKSDYFFWDVEDCATSNKNHSFICERSYDSIGCIYGNGNQYFGNASVATSGRTCLSWSDPEVTRSLMTRVPSKEAREKLRSHNYCRNPNPNKESRPWCFTGPRGEYEYCDIPHCGKILSKKSHLTGKCKPKHFECLPGECIPSPWVCDGQEDCTNGADELKCSSHMNFFKKYPNRRLDGYEVEKWLNTPAKTCALRCKEADFTCRSFTHRFKDNTCYLSDSNIGMTGALVESGESDYYEMRDHTIDCEDMFQCANQKCINKTKVCDGKNDCFDRSDEKICTIKNLGYEIRLAGANSSHEGRVEVKILGQWGQVCDDAFDMVDAGVICRELGFEHGVLEVKPGGFFGNLDPPEAFMVDQLKCQGNESTIRECDFEGWGKHNCEPQEAVGVVCKTELDTCKEGHWKCDNASACIPTPFICDEVTDCPDGSDESPIHCDAPFELRLANGTSPLEGRVEIRHHGIWGTVCDDDFSNATAKVICRSLGYGGPAMVKKDGYFGPGVGPIWLDEVFCYGNEKQLYKCEHDHWGRHNCDHDEDAGVVCTAGPVSPDYESSVKDSGSVAGATGRSQVDVDELLPSQCGKRLEDFDDDDELIIERVVRSSIAPRGSYPWQASIRIRGHSKSSHWCGAVVLSPLHVLTAAHCLDGYNKGTYFVRAGDYNTEIDEGTEVEANIQDYYIHEEFRKGHRLNNDLAVVLLKGRGMALGRNVMPICLPYENLEYPAGLNCTISGFGSLEIGSTAHSRQMRFGWVPLLDQSVCKADHVYGKGSITDGMICAGHLDGGPDTCDGDSGGPLACLHNGAFTLYGLTSWGQHCGRANKPGVYVRIAYYRKWIDQKIRESLGR